jgi:hypothetical protein
VRQSARWLVRRCSGDARSCGGAAGMQAGAAVCTLARAALQRGIYTNVSNTHPSHPLQAGNPQVPIQDEDIISTLRRHNHTMGQQLRQHILQVGLVRRCRSVHAGKHTACSCSCL